MDRTYVVTGAASGIGAATARHLRERGDRVIGCDLHDADVVANLATIEGRAKLVDGVLRLSGGRIDAIVARMVPMRGAFPGRPEQMGALLAWCVSPENSLMAGQILFVDGGIECSLRGERSW